jgi:hypothetical protein
MPHLDSLMLRSPFHSPFARPVAAITRFVKRLGDALAHAGAQPPKPRIRQDLDVRRYEDQYARAIDHADLERMERAFDRREAEGLRMWDWR